MNSRQGKTPDASAQWLKNTAELVKILVEHKAVVISSLGMTTWEVVTWLVGSEEGSLILIVPDIDPEYVPGFVRGVIEDFQLVNSKLLFIFPDKEAKQSKNYRKLPKKDFWIASLADRIYPISVRNGGNQSRIIELFSVVPGRVSDKFVVEYQKPSSQIFHPDQLPKLKDKGDAEWEFLTHWTRTAINPWPGETKAEYYRSFFQQSEGYSHSGFNTLCRILRDMTIMGSDKLIRGVIKTVSLTEIPPWQINRLIRWRSPLQRWTFEPYGIAIKKGRLNEEGCRRVIYGWDYQYRFLQEDDRPYFQAIERDGYDWRQEREWRCVGDLDLKKFEPRDVKVIVHTFEEAEQLGEWSPFPVVCWEDFGLDDTDDENK